MTGFCNKHFNKLQCQERNAIKITLKNRNSTTHNSLLAERKSQFTKSQSEVFKVASFGSTVYVRNFCARNFRNFHNFLGKIAKIWLTKQADFFICEKLSCKNILTQLFRKVYLTKVFVFFFKFFFFLTILQNSLIELKHTQWIATLYNEITSL